MTTNFDDGPHWEYQTPEGRIPHSFNEGDTETLSTYRYDPGSTELTGGAICNKCGGWKWLDYYFGTYPAQMCICPKSHETKVKCPHCGKPIKLEIG
jgi:hypothetical protein